MKIKNSISVLKYLSFFAAFLLCTSIVFGATTANGIKYPASQVFVNTKNHESLWMDCNIDASGSIKCAITKIGVIHKTPYSGHLLSGLLNWITSRKKTCYMFEAHYIVKFHYSAAQGVWIWRDTHPYGICGIMQTGYLTKNKKIKSAGSWNYNENSIFTKKTGYFCSKTHAHSSHFYGLMNLKNFSDSTQEVNCKYMDLSSSVLS